MFVYNSYLSTWNRLLLNSTARGYREYLELELIPANPNVPANWQRISDHILRLHSIPIKPQDMHSHMPSPMIGMMRHYLGYPVMRRMMYGDVMAEIDLKKVYSRMRGGGIPLVDAKKEM